MIIDTIKIEEGNFMKLNPRFLTHQTKGEHYMISTGDTVFKGIVKNNETAAFIIQCLQTDTTEEAIVERLLAAYEGADRATVTGDVANIIDKLRSIGAIEE